MYRLWTENKNEEWNDIVVREDFIQKLLYNLKADKSPGIDMRSCQTTLQYL